MGVRVHVNEPRARSSNLLNMGKLVATCAIVSTMLWGAAGAAAGADPAGTGYLDVASDPPAKIAIDDADTGKVTPQPHLEVKAGHHKLTLTTLDGAHTRTIGFTVGPGETRKFSFHLAS